MGIHSSPLDLASGLAAATLERTLTVQLAAPQTLNWAAIAISSMERRQLPKRLTLRPPGVYLIARDEHQT